MRLVLMSLLSESKHGLFSSQTNYELLACQLAGMRVVHGSERH